VHVRCRFFHSWCRIHHQRSGASVDTPGGPGVA
jgi:hypothetical protein